MLFTFLIANCSVTYSIVALSVEAPPSLIVEFTLHPGAVDKCVDHTIHLLEGVVSAPYIEWCSVVDDCRCISIVKQFDLLSDGHVTCLTDSSRALLCLLLWLSVDVHHAVDNRIGGRLYEVQTATHGNEHLRGVFWSIKLYLFCARFQPFRG